MSAVHAECIQQSLRFFRWVFAPNLPQESQKLFVDQSLGQRRPTTHNVLWIVLQDGAATICRQRLDLHIGRRHTGQQQHSIADQRSATSLAGLG